MKKIVKMSLAASMLMGISATGVQAADILTNIKADGQIRARYEMVDAKNNNLAKANAFTNRLAIGVGADIAGQDWISAYAQMINVSALNENYGEPGNAANRHDVVADQKQSRLAQAYIDLKYNKTLLRVGRQSVSLDNQRFISAVDWRQMPVTFDAIALVDNTIENLTLVAGYVTQVNDFRDVDGIDTRAVVLNASYKIMPELKITAYDYMIGAGTATPKGTPNTNNNILTGGSDTYGMALTGDIKPTDSATISYRAEYAKQKKASLKVHSEDTKWNNRKADYYMLQVDADVQGFLAGIQYEVMGAADKAGDLAFMTPLTTRHGFNGWADAFNPRSMPEEGLRDLNFSLGYKNSMLGMFKINYRDFKSDKGSIKYGTEWDAIYTRAIPGVSNLSGMLKFARFDAKESEVGKNPAGAYADIRDTTKFWAMLDYKFATK